MKKGKLKHYGLLGLCSAVLGLVVFATGFCMTGCDLSDLSNVEYKTFHYAESAGANIQTVKIDYDVANVNVVFGEELTIDYPKRYKKNGDEISKIVITEENGVLSIKETAKFVLAVFDFTEIPLTLTLPTDRVFALDITTDTGDISLPSGGNYLSLDIETDTGDVSIKQTDCALNAEIETDTGNIKISDFTCAGLNISTDTGDVTLTDCSIAENVEIETDTGNVKTSGTITAEKIEIETDTGDVKTSGTITATSFSVDTSTGDVRIKDVLDATMVSIDTSTGNVYALLKGTKANYQTSVETRTGDSNITDSSEGERRLILDTSTGDITIKFVD